MARPRCSAVTGGLPRIAEESEMTDFIPTLTFDGVAGEQLARSARSVVAAGSVRFGAVDNGFTHAAVRARTASGNKKPSMRRRRYGSSS